MVSDIPAPSARWLRVLFHILFWTYWLGTPFITAENEQHFNKMVLLIPVMLTNIPLFLLNTEWLLPRFLPQSGLTRYFSAVMLLAIAFIFIQLYTRFTFVDCWSALETRHIMRTIFAVLFVTAVSTGYGLANYIVGKEHIHEQERAERLRSEVDFLRSQISPHFIFNVLNSIVYLIRTKSDAAEPTTIQLSSLLRYALYESGDKQVALATELEYLKNYVNLQKIRFGDDITIDMQVTGQLGGHRIEPMLLIPFVENAFKHGSGMIEEPVIHIRLEMRGQQLLFKVRNKVSPESATTKDSSSGIGLRNIARRLELLYGTQAQLDVQNAGGWFEIALQIQLRNG